MIPQRVSCLSWHGGDSRAVLGHSSIHVTREIYTHVTPPMQCDAAERVAGRIFRNGVPSRDRSAQRCT